MKKIIFAGILALLFSPQIHAQYFSVKDIEADDPYEGTSVFPEIVAPESKSAGPEMAANRINNYLKYEVLNKGHGNEGDNIFSEVFPAEDEFGGQGEFSYDVISNNARFISIEISNSFTGAYMEYEDRTYTFSSDRGEHLTLKDFFEGEHYEAIIDLAAQGCRNTILDYFQTMDPEDEFAEDKRVMYEECLSYFDSDEPLYFGFYLSDSSMTITYSRCSNHMMAALDDLWDFHIPFSFEELRPYLSNKGRSILFNEAHEIEENAHLPDHKVLSGTLDGKHRIYAIFSSLSPEYLHGVYWYDKDKQPISIHGSRMDDGKFEYWEEVNEERFARIELIYQNGQLMGVWERVDGSSSFPIVLSLD